MANETIGASNLFDDGYDKSIIAGVERITNAFRALETQQNKNLDTIREIVDKVNTFSNLDDINKVTEAYKKQEKALNDLNSAKKGAAAGEIEAEKLRQQQLKTEQQQLKNSQEKEKALQAQLRTEQAVNKEAEKSAKAKAKETAETEKQNRAYVQLSKQLNTMRDRYKDLAAAEQGSSKEARALLVDIQKLDTKLKSIDGSVGQFQRNVGNYASALNNFRASVTNILGAAGISLGASAGFDFLKDSIAEFTKSEKVVKDLGFALKTLSGEGEPALERLNAQAESLEATFGLFESEDISILQKQLVQLGLNSKDVEKLTPKIIDLAAATGKSLPEATDIAIKAINGQTKGLKEVGLEFEDTGKRTDNYNILLENLDKFQGSAAQSADTLEGKQTRVAIAWGNIKEAVGEYLVGAADKLLDSFDVLTGKVSNFDLALKTLAPTLRNNAKLLTDAGIEKAQSAAAALVKQRVELTKELEKEGSNRTKILEELRENFEQEKFIRQAILDKQNEAKAKSSFEDNNTIETSGKSKTPDQIAEENAKRAKIEADKKKDAEIAAAAEEAVVIPEIKKEQAKSEAEIAADLTAYKLNLSALEYEQAKKVQDEKDKLAKAEKEKRLKEAADLAQQVFAIAEKEIKEQQELKEKAFENDISNAEKNLDFQRQLAIAGRDNNVAQAEKDLLDAQAAKEEQEKKAIKQEKTLAFFKLFAANAEKDPATALTKTITESLLANAVAGAFFTGTEKVEDSLKGNKVHNGRDGYQIRVDGGERILTGDQNKMIGDISNDHLAAIAHDYQMGRLLPNEAIDFAIPVRSTGENMHNNIQMNRLIGEVNGLRDELIEIKNKPVSNFYIDSLGRYVEDRISKGLREIFRTNPKHNLK